MKNSQYQTLLIDSIVTPDGGVIGMCACPGRNQVKVASEHWQRNLTADVATITKWRADYLVTLIETSEFGKLGVVDLPRKASQATFDWIHLPVPDFNAPDFSQASHHNPLDEFLDSKLKQGKRIVIHCAAGKGRTGTIAAALLIRQGWDVVAAVAKVRKARPGAIESEKQMNFLLRYRDPKVSAD